MAQLAYDMAAAEGFKIPFENVATFGSHSHSGPGAITSEMLWALAPPTDLLVPGSHSNHDAIVINCRVTEDVGFLNCYCYA